MGSKGTWCSGITPAQHAGAWVQSSVCPLPQAVRFIAANCVALHVQRLLKHGLLIP